MYKAVKHAQDAGIDPLVGATFLSVIGAGSIVGRMAMGSISDRIGRKLSIIICLLLLAIMMFWLIKIRTVWAFYVFSAIFGFGYPPFLGGPFWTMGSIGKDKLNDRLSRLAERHGGRFAPAL